jgi:hypothetical protein
MDDAVDYTPVDNTEEIAADVDTGDAIADEPADIPEEQPLAADGDTEETAPVAEAPVAEQLEDGVRVVERNGKKEYRLSDTRYPVFLESLHLRRELEQRLVPDSVDGKPVSVDDIRSALKLREDTYLGNQDMHLDFKAGDAVKYTDDKGTPISCHQAFIKHWIEQGQKAIQNGDATEDPFIGLAATLFDTAAKSHPEAYAQIQSRAARQLLDDVYEEAANQMAANKDDTNLFYAAQHFEKLLFSKYRKSDGSEVVVQREQRQQPRRSQPQNGNGPQPVARPDAGTQRWDNFRVKTDTDSKSAIRTEVEGSLAEIKNAYVKAGLPDTYEAVLDRLNSLVHKELKGDAEWQRQLRIELRNAQISNSEQRRQQIGEIIARRHATRAKQIIARSIGAIKAEASKALKVNLDAAHGRRAAAQEKRTPAGGGPAPRGSLIPARDSGEWNSRNPKESFSRELDRLLG